MPEPAPDGDADLEAVEQERRGWRNAQEGRGMAKTVLIVEDNELNMKLFHDLLEAHGYRPSAPATGSTRWILRASIVPT